MHIGFRYHIASLVAVFFSLFLGMLVGSTLFQDDRLVKEQGFIINDLESRFRATEARTQALQAKLELYRGKEQVTLAGWDDIIPSFVAGRLATRQVVLATSSEGMDWSRWETLVELAGAEVATTLQLADTSQLAEWTLNDQAQPILVIWVEDKLPGDISHSIGQLVEAGWFVCYLQPMHNDYSLSNMGENILVIDIADTPVGELAFIAGLSQGISGNFGIKREATALYPAFDWLEIP